MILSIRNLAKIRQADIELNGLTVIAGDNDTGKSTVGKALYAMFNGFKDMTRTVSGQRCRSLANAVFNVATAYDEFPYQKPSMLETINVQYELEEILKKEHDLTLNFVLGAAVKLVNARYQFDLLSDSTKYEELRQRLGKILDIDDYEIECQRVGSIFDMVFQHQSNSLQTDSVAEINMQVKNQSITAVLKDNACVKAEIDFNLNHGAIYVDNPFVIDRLSNKYFYRDHIMMKSLERKLRKKEKVDLVTDIINNKTLNTVMEIIDNIVPGVFVENDKVFSLTRQEWREPLNVANLSTGVKSFAVFKLLIQNNQLKEKDVVILDEPEIHLHPEWQVKYAEFLVLFQKAFDLTVLLTTHSPYFLNAIEVYTQKYNSMETLKVYKTEKDSYGVICEDVTANMEKVYASMAMPFEMMAQMEDELGMID